MSAKIVVGWFDEFPPLTFDGILRYGDALTELDRAADLRRFAADRWTRVELSAAQQTEFLDRYGALLTDADHQARLEALLWANRARETRRLYPLLRAGQRALAEARLLLAGRSRRGVDRAVKAVPAELAEDEGLIYERVRWRRRADNTEGAIELLALEPAVPSRPDRWWTERNILARRLFADGDHLGAYELVHDRQGLSRSDLAEAEWLSGWLALRFIDRPDLAEGHFRRLYENVGTPISLARGAYWLGRTFETLGNRDEATLWFQAAARHDTAFYGQLAAGWLGLPSVARLPDDPPVSPEALSAFEVNDLVDIILALDQIGETVHADRFLRVLAGQSDDPAHLALTSGLALTLERRHIAVRSAKQASARGPLLIEAGYPILELSAAAPGPDTALLLALIRQESEFRVDAISRSGARGLMQLMPATARRMSRQLGVPHSIRRLTADP
ncbi:MAG: lytic transglycosylase domain-containing protein, partial [Inquilinus sp.]|nr:lytic transglycosylase domain-containing protein [Inquilinus sp.]